MRLLLHICCAPCSLYPVKHLAKNKFEEVVGYYYNPNIHPPSEYKRREDALRSIEKEVAFRVIYPSYEMEEYFTKTLSRKDSPDRCSLCWELRLSKTADFAKEKGFDSFTTTLLISPYQDHERVKDIGQRQARERGIKFYYEDFRKGFKDSQQEAKDKKLYRQKYCGCIFSQLERENDEK